MLSLVCAFALIANVATIIMDRYFNIWTDFEFIGCYFLYVFTCLVDLLVYKSCKLIMIAVSSTSPNSSFMAVPNVFIDGESVMYAFTNGGIFSPSSRTFLTSVL